MMVVALKKEFQGRVTAEELKQFMKEFVNKGKLPKYAVPGIYQFVDQLPKTSVGKMDKKWLRKQYSKPPK